MCVCVFVCVFVFEAQMTVGMIRRLMQRDSCRIHHRSWFAIGPSFVESCMRMLYGSFAIQLTCRGSVFCGECECVSF